jgi:predicted Zn-dependent protease
VLFQAALVVAPENFMAANELGVVLAKFGRLGEAQVALEHAASLSNAPTAWRNLAVVCDRRGDAPRAAQARQQADAIVARLQQSGQANAGSKYAVEWVEPDAFAQSHSALVHAPAPMAKPSAMPDSAAPPAATAAKPAEKSGGWKWPWQ